ncbi:hypothetical protein [Nostoc sp. CMAA1605]|uniref:hypothetical protein n=1 Tax=Nostoc sp. CMAA1605 TaxID=2055159 RepID=UPI001F343786|nr:hypothetical protein [Nostoc sp. CMAA1605]MCF4968066.1 hypothetical protein [Nostoc sp. CMAA1605]
MTLVKFLPSYQRIQQALQWWSSRQSTKLFVEAEKIRDDLLQETFTIRRHLDVLTANNLNLSNHQTQDYLRQIDNFHHSLVQLSNRLFPESLPDSFPLAIECLIEPWLAINPHLYFHLDLPVYWRQEQAFHSLTVLSILDELLTINLSNIITGITIYISLKQQKNQGQLKIQINYHDITSFMCHTNSTELKYLCDTFQVLTSGRCFYRASNCQVIWHLSW